MLQLHVNRLIVVCIIIIVIHITSVRIVVPYIEDIESP